VLDVPRHARFRTARISSGGPSPTTGARPGGRRRPRRRSPWRSRPADGQCRSPACAIEVLRCPVARGSPSRVRGDRMGPALNSHPAGGVVGNVVEPLGSGPGDLHRGRTGPSTVRSATRLVTTPRAISRTTKMDTCSWRSCVRRAGRSPLERSEAKHGGKADAAETYVSYCGRMSSMERPSSITWSSVCFPTGSASLAVGGPRARRSPTPRHERNGAPPLPEL
jgi:hypothetical protein